MRIENVSSLLKLHDKRNPVYKRETPLYGPYRLWAIQRGYYND